MQHLSSPSLMLRRFCCLATPSAAVLSTSPIKKKKLVFLGSPSVSASVLESLLDASSASDSLFQVAAIVTQPASGRDRGRKEAFLSDFSALEPELCITAAYGNILTTKFLKIPSLGTVNIHPSLLPFYRGAAPVQRALQDGVNETGVSLAFTVRALDAGPIIACEKMEIDDRIKDGVNETGVSLAFTVRALDAGPIIALFTGTVNIHPSLLPFYRGAAPVQRALQDGVNETGVSLAFTVRALDAGPIIACEKMEIDDRIKAPELLDLLFAQGSKLLLQELPFIFDGSAKTKAQEQNDSKATLAPKISQEESFLSFDQEASVLHNKVRAFAGWPGTRARILVIDEKNDKCSELELKVITSRVYKGDDVQSENDEVTFRKGSLIIPCGGHTTLEILEVQLPGKKVVNAAAFWNGLRGQKLKKLQS